jgi:hypothetical protein
VVKYLFILGGKEANGLECLPNMGTRLDWFAAFKRKSTQKAFGEKQATKITTETRICHNCEFTE